VTNGSSRFATCIIAALHDTGNEKIWWKAHKIDAAAEAEQSWDARRPPSQNGTDTTDDRRSVTSQ